MLTRQSLLNSCRILIGVVILALLVSGTGLVTSAQGTGDAGQLSGRLGGPLQNVQARFGEPNRTDTNLIGYNSQILAGVDSIVVIYYDERSIVNKISLVYLTKPTEFADTKAIADAVAQVAPMDGTCAALKLSASSFGSEVYSCQSEALETPFDEATMTALDLIGSPGTYSYSVDPTIDEYFEIIVQPGTGVFTSTSSTGSTAESPDSSQDTSNEGPLTAEEQEYTSTVVEQTQLMTSSLDRFSELTQAPDAFTDNWIILVAAELATWQVVYEEASTMNVPPRFAAVHTKYLEGLSYYSQAADEIAYGIDFLDPSAFERAVTLLNLGNLAIQDARKELDALGIA